MREAGHPSLPWIEGPGCEGRVRLESLTYVLSLAHLVAPQPAQRFGQDRSAVLAVVAPVAEHELVVVLLVLQRRRHLLVGQRPVAVLVVQVARAVLQEDADRLLLGLADQAG